MSKFPNLSKEIGAQGAKQLTLNPVRAGYAHDCPTRLALAIFRLQNFTSMDQTFCLFASLQVKKTA
jgi:hypothetical protein